MSKLTLTIKDIKITAASRGAITNLVSLELTCVDKGFEKQENAYAKACDYRENLVGVVAGAVATEAKLQFENKDVEIVHGSMNFGPSVLSTTVYREFKVEDSDATIMNHLVVSCEDDFTNTVNESIAGIFDEVEAEA